MKRLAVIGCGLRGDCYMSELRDGLGKQWQLSALADPNPTAIEVYRRNYGNDNVLAFKSGPELLREMSGKLDAVIITSPNFVHTESVLPALEQGLTILLEKPVDTTIDACRRIWRSYTAAGQPPLVIGFVLRYTSFYRKIKQLIDDGAIGQVLLIEATELMGAPLTALYLRDWRSRTAMAGPLLLEKCCHDFDLLNMLAGGSARRVSSFGALTRFVPEPAAAMHCKDCNLTSQCRYTAGKVAPYLMQVSRRDEIIELIPEDNDRCVFNLEKDIWDHQVANIEYENGILATFTVAMDQPKTTRRIRIAGTQGQIEGDIGLDELELSQHLEEGSEGQRVTKIEIQHDDSGHHGGDSVLSQQFKAMLKDEPLPPAAGLREGVEASILALMSEQSQQEDRIIHVDEIYRDVFNGQ